MKVRLRDAVVRADDAALHDREEVLAGVDADKAGESSVFVGGVVHLPVVRELGADLAVHRALIRREGGRLVGVPGDDRLDVLRRDVGHVEGAHATVTLNQRQDSLLRRGRAMGADLGLAADVGLIGLYDLVSAAEEVDRGVVAHGLADAVAEEPSRFVLYLKDAADLKRRHALLGRAHEVRGLKAEIERDTNVLEHRANSDAELLFAIAATMQADADALLGVGLDLRDPARATAVRAHRAVRPDRAFEVGEGGYFIVEMGAGQDGHGRTLQCCQPTLGMPCLQAT